MKTIKYISCFLAFALVLAWQAQAATYWTLLMTQGTSSATTGYSAYYCTKAQAATFFGEGNDTYDKVAAYLTESKENYEAGMKALAAGGVELEAYGQYGTQLAYSKYFDTALSGDYIAVISYASASADANNQVRVFGNTAANGSLRLDPNSSVGGNASDWATVPEPTSGMLLLLGVAGLALKRKRA